MADVRAPIAARNRRRLQVPRLARPDFNLNVDSQGFRACLTHEQADSDATAKKTAADEPRRR